MARVHPSSIVDRGAELADDAIVGPFCHVHAGVRIGAGTLLVSHVVVTGNATLGSANVIHPFAVIGGEAQVRKGTERGASDQRAFHDARGERGALEIGDSNVFREAVTVSASSGDGTTSIGSHNLFMAGCHVAHDVVVGSHCVVANAVQLAGHVEIEDWVTFGGLSGVAQHLRIGQGAFVAAGAMCERDVPPFVIAQGDRARVRALNLVGLERRGVPVPSVRALSAAFARLWGRGGRASSSDEAGADVHSGFDQAVRTLDRSDPWVRILAEWLEDPARHIRPARRSVPPR
jgi:UDP-N-acetylglucosamine acyltransferase